MQRFDVFVFDLCFNNESFVAEGGRVDVVAVVVWDVVTKFTSIVSQKLIILCMYNVHTNFLYSFSYAKF